MIFKQKMNPGTYLWPPGSNIKITHFPDCCATAVEEAPLIPMLS